MGFEVAEGPALEKQNQLHCGLGTSELYLSVQEPHWVVGAYSCHIKGRYFPSKRLHSPWSLWQSLSYSFQQGTKIPSKQGPRSGLPWWLSGKESTHQCKRRGFNPWVGEIPWRRKWQPTPVFLPGEPYGQRSLASYSPWGLKELATT